MRGSEIGTDLHLAPEDVKGIGQGLGDGACESTTEEFPGDAVFDRGIWGDDLAETLIGSKVDADIGGDTDGSGNKAAAGGQTGREMAGNAPVETADAALFAHDLEGHSPHAGDGCSGRCWLAGDWRRVLEQRGHGAGEAWRCSACWGRNADRRARNGQTRADEVEGVCGRDRRDAGERTGQQPRGGVEGAPVGSQELVG